MHSMANTARNMTFAYMTMTMTMTMTIIGNYDTPALLNKDKNTEVEKNNIYISPIFKH